MYIVVYVVNKVKRPYIMKDMNEDEKEWRRLMKDLWDACEDPR